MISLCTVLSFISVLKLPFGGKITLGQSVPIILFSYKRGAKYAIRAGMLYGVFKALFSVHIFPASSFLSFVLIIILDYVLPYMFMGMSSLFVPFFKSRRLNILISCFLSHMFKLFCSVVSGVLCWKSYVPSNLNIWLYSFLYNSSYAVPETIVSLVIIFLILNYLSEKSFI